MFQSDPIGGAELIFEADLVPPTLPSSGRDLRAADRGRWQSAGGEDADIERDRAAEFVDKGEHFHLCLETDDAATAADLLKRNGVRLLEDVHDTPWGTREFAIKDDQGHTLYLGESR